MQLGADVRPLLIQTTAFLEPAATKIVQDIRSFVATTVLNTSEHRYTLYPLAQLAAYYLQRHGWKQKQDTIDNFPCDWWPR
jgi:hypothetical protein